MSDPNPYADDSYKWGPPQQPGNPPTVADGQGHDRPGSGTPAYGYPQQLPESAAQPGPGYGYPQGQAAQPTMPGYGFPQQPGALPGGGVPMLTFGDITVMNDQIVTPAGTMPLKGAVWTATDLSRTEEKIPTVAIVLAIVFALLCLVGLLFLLMKEKQTTGFIQVSVTSGGRHHSTMIPAMGPDTFPMVMAQLNTARAMSI
ncbi:hypothetical protein [Streptomyces sp. Ncost-T10-10d]|uniref:hypothetical protein n=1 Tax=Streptomyces sp. Ncost-T10-10d TaxID=1839774 RepID=UPI00081ECF90|nr:hypothetical protein [Streptomyces sp. Ncost-T10-10d]SCF96384.1 hypothetical protein GA0115254_128134 [Streptomyces sp. Ncost-T10-10d]